MQEFLTAFIDPANIPGHISYMLLIVSMLMRRMHLLRVFALAAGTFSAVYYFSLGDMVSLFWEVIFTLVNLVQLIILLVENRAGRYSSDEQMFIETVLRGLERMHIRKLMKHGEVREYGPGKIVATENEAIDGLYFVVDGQASVLHGDRTIGHVRSGDFIGEMSYLTGRKATASVVADTALRLIRFDRETLREHLLRHPEVRHALESGFNRNLVEKLVKTNASAKLLVDGDEVGISEMLPESHAS